MKEQGKYDKAYKEQVVLRILAKDTTAIKMAEELGVHYTTVRDWVRNYRRDVIALFLAEEILSPRMKK